jgi:antitoxin VapB
MTLTVDDAEADRLAAEFAALTGEPIAQAITEALRERLERERRARQRSREGVAERLMEIGRRYAALPDRDTRSADEILGYDEHGLPT